jgi:hypothetical protein
MFSANAESNHIKPLDSLDLIKPLDLFALWLRQDARTLVNA